MRHYCKKCYSYTCLCSPRPLRRVGGHLGLLEGIGQNESVGHTGDRDMVEATGHAEQLLERAGQRAVARPAGQQQRPVDIEQKDSGEHG